MSFQTLPPPSNGRAKSWFTQENIHRVYLFEIKNDMHKNSNILQYKILHNTLIFQLILVSLSLKYVIMK